MKFDFCAANPPYHGTKGVGHTVYENHTLRYSEIATSSVVVHPPGWRRPRPGTSKMRSLKELMWSRCSLLSISPPDSEFDAGTRHDYFKLEESPCEELRIEDERGETWVIMKPKWNFIPNHSFGLIRKLLGSGASVIKTSDYHSTTKSHVSKEKKSLYKFPVAHSITSSGKKFLWSSRDDLGHFGVSKVILSDAAPVGNVIIDLGGKYGMSEHCIGIPVSGQKEANQVKKALLSPAFEEVISATSWSNFQIDWRIFEGFCEGWHEIILNMI